MISNRHDYIHVQLSISIKMLTVSLCNDVLFMNAYKIDKLKR